MMLRDFQVLQRDAQGCARVTLDSGEQVELSTGGPYSVGGADQVLVGDIWILAGQSNMEGVGDLEDVEPPSPFAHSFQSREEWAVAEEPLHCLHDSPRSVHRAIWGLPPLTGKPGPPDLSRVKGAGLGLPFAKLRHERSGIPIGLIPSAHSGTSLVQWDPAMREMGGSSLYGAMIERGMAVGGKIAGVLWYQGENDAGVPADYPLYTKRTTKLIEAIRRDFGQPDLPFYYVQLGRWTASPDAQTTIGWNSVREAQRNLHKSVPNTAMVAAIDLDLDDGIHISTAGLKKLGRRLADVADGIPTPDLAQVRYEPVKQRLRVSFDHVRGALQSAGRPSGFSLRLPNGMEGAWIYKVQIEGSDVLLHLDQPVFLRGISLWYGYGVDPYCNITDAEGAAIPAFGPAAII